MKEFRVNRRTYRWHDEDCTQSVDGLPDQFNDWPSWPRHILNVEGEKGFFIRVRIDHTLGHVEKAGHGIRAWKEWAYNRWLPRVPYSWRPKREYFPDSPVMFGPMLVLGAGFAASKSAVLPNTVLSIRPRIAALPNRALDTVVVSRLIQWIFSGGFRPKPYYHYDFVSRRTIRCTGPATSGEMAAEDQSSAPGDR
jgi:hypothetical protein